jgi:NADP-reducing hydrogenase subunit HndB
MKNLEELKKLRDSVKPVVDVGNGGGRRIRVLVGMATCGIAAGAGPVLSSITEEVEKRGLSGLTVKQTGCIGICQFEPIVEVYETGKEKVTYVNMTPEKAVRVVSSHLVNGNIVNEFVIGQYTA